MAQPSQDPPGTRDNVHEGAPARDDRAEPPALRDKPHDRASADDDRALSPSLRIVAIAESHGGRISTQELLGAGISRSTISRWAKQGRLHPHGRGVYLLGHRAEQRRGPLEGALLASPNDATLGYHAAAWVDGWGPQADPPFDVLVPPTASGRTPSVRIHRTDLRPGERIVRHGLPITTAPRTLLDLATVLTPDRLESLVAEAIVQRRATLKALDAIARDRPGAAALRAVLAHERGPGLTRSDVEVLLRRILRDAALPGARLNTTVHGHSVDAFWPTHRLALEVDSLAFHRHAAKFERDRRKGLDLAARGIELLRASALTVRDQPLVLVARLASALALREAA